MSTKPFKPAVPGHWGVIDTLATGGPRIHTPVPGASYPLTADQFTSMPAAHAAKFLVSRAFVVVDSEGQQQNALPSSQSKQAGQAPALHLKPDETIASFDELTAQALLARAVRLPGGEKFSSKTKRDTLQRFLLDAKSKGQGGGIGARNGGDQQATGGGDDLIADEDDEKGDAAVADKLLGDGTEPAGSKDDAADISFES